MSAGEPIINKQNKLGGGDVKKSEKVSGGKLTEGQVLADTDHGEQLLFIVPRGQQVVEWLGKGRQLVHTFDG